MIHGILGIWNYWIVIILMMTGLFIVISRHNLVKKMVGLTIFQSLVHCQSQPLLADRID